MPDHGYELMCEGRPVGLGSVQTDSEVGYLWTWEMPCGATQAGTADTEAGAWADMESAIQDWYGAMQ